MKLHIGKKNTLKDQIFDYTNVMVMLIIGFLTLYPIWYTLVLAFNDGQDSMLGGIYWLPRKFTFDNFKAIFENKAIYTAFGVTVARTFTATSVHVFFTAMIAYAFSKKQLLGRKIYLALGTVSLFFNGGLIPVYLLYRNLGLVNNFLVYILPGMFSFYNLIIFTSFFRTIPYGLEESAKIDGANDFMIFARIILPLSKPVLATIALFVGVYNWNDFFMGVIYMNNPSLQPIQTFMLKIIAQNSEANEIMRGIPTDIQESTGITSRSVSMATMFVTVAPIMAIYPFLQKYFVKGLLMGSIKG